MDNKYIWIVTGYEIFALAGTHGLKIETLAKRVGISKSSFYHHFADMEIFIDQLLSYHLHQSHIIAEKEQRCPNIDPALISIFIEHKTDLLFNRQLRIQRENKSFNEVLLKSGAITGGAFAMVWLRSLNLTLNQKQLEGIFELALENFFLQITPESLNQSWLSAYFANLKRIAGNFNG